MNKEEVWKDVKHYEGLYQVSNLGRVKSLKRKGRLTDLILKSGVSDSGYNVVGLSKYCVIKTRTVHQLVAIAFLNHTPCGYDLVVDHIDCNKRNNSAINLRLVKHGDNVWADTETTSKYKGVSWREDRQKWRAQITRNSKTKYLGMFTCELAAAKAYQNKLKEIKEGGSNV